MYLEKCLWGGGLDSIHTKEGYDIGLMVT